MHTGVDKTHENDTECTDVGLHVTCNALAREDQMRGRRTGM